MSNPFESPNTPSEPLKAWPDKPRFLVATAVIAITCFAAVACHEIVDLKLVIAASMVVSVILACFNFGVFEADVGLMMIPFGALYGAYCWWAAFETFHPLDRYVTFFRYMILTGGGAAIVNASSYVVVRLLRKWWST